MLDLVQVIKSRSGDGSPDEVGKAPIHRAGSALVPRPIPRVDQDRPGHMALGRHRIELPRRAGAHAGLCMPEEVRTPSQTRIPR